MPDFKIFPSLLSADFGKLQSEIERFEPFVEGFHFDVMDGHFVPNLTMGAPVLKKLRTKHLFDVHLMVSNPEDRIAEFAEAGASLVSFHVETVYDRVTEIAFQIKQAGMRAGIAIKPGTGLEEIWEYIPDVDFVLVMSVEPGYSGQSFRPEVLAKIKELRTRFPDLDIEIDGGINAETVQEARAAGANLIVSASYLFGAENAEEAVKKLRT